MKPELISMYIDDELDLDQKVEFVEGVTGDGELKSETIALLRLEKLLRHESRRSEFKPLSYRRYLVAASLAAVLVVSAVLMRPLPEETPYRFVIYSPEARQAEVVGSFSGWQPVALQKIGDTGYWELVLPLTAGEHRYAYIVDNRQRLADPSVVLREDDDFSGQNSIIRIGGDA